MKTLGNMLFIALFAMRKNFSRGFLNVDFIIRNENIDSLRILQRIICSCECKCLGVYIIQTKKGLTNKQQTTKNKIKYIAL